MTDPVPVAVALRDATAAAHRHIETVFSLPALCSRPAYRRVLSALCAFHDAWEPAAQAVLPAADAAWLRARSRHAWLRQDLQALGGAVALPQADAPHVARRLGVDGAAAAWGGVYVTEGASLGGLLIARHLHDTLGLGADDGARYYSGHGAATAALWRECTARLQAALGHDAAARRQACAAAVRAFDVMTALLQQALGPGPACPAPHDALAAA